MNNFEIEITDQDIEDWKKEFTDKESYLKWIDNWKKEYKELSQQIRSIKGQRKQFKWEYREKGQNAVKRRTKIGENPLYESSASWKVAPYRSKAREMMKQRITAKWISRIMRDNNIKEAA